jgi:hypothetical protein
VNKEKITFISYVKEITKEESVSLIQKFHYSKVLPRLNKAFLGGFDENDELVATITLGWGVRPVHTIKKLFPSLDSKDYYEIGKMCLDDRMPRNSESQFLSLCMRYIKQNMPQIKLIFTWADGMLGKAGYVYQASNFLYGGFIWTDTYFTSSGEKVHPRMTGKIGGRPTLEFMEANTFIAVMKREPPMDRTARVKISRPFFLKVFLIERRNGLDNQRIPDKNSPMTSELVFKGDTP